MKVAAEQIDHKSISLENYCPGCSARVKSVFYEVEDVPVHDVMLMPTPSVALNYQKGDIALGFCEHCGLIANLAFQPDLLDYSPQCEETQAFSPTFSSHDRRLALRLIERHNLHNKTILDIGCGKGDFLNLLCELGKNHGLGFDPAYAPERNGHNGNRVNFIQDYYSEKYANHRSDFVSCKMTLEHIAHPAEFVRMIRSALENQPNTVVFFQVPDASQIFEGAAFWDVYYEHCNYFTPASITRLFVNCGFEMIDLWNHYNDQYLILEARPATKTTWEKVNQAYDLKTLEQRAKAFSKNSQRKADEWKKFIRSQFDQGRRVVLWGSGSKAVSFLTTLKIGDEITYVVDINPYRQGTYVPGTGHEIVAPEFLRNYKPHTVIVMNPIYREEITEQLNQWNLFPEVLTV
jgi:SAM-dependent methyltransferase